MSAKIWGFWVGACAMAAAGPGELDRNFEPELRAWVSPWHVTMGPDGRAWVGGGFDRADGESVGDLVRLGENGGVADEPAPGYLGKNPGMGSGYAYAPFPLANGDVLLPGQSGGWLRMDGQGRPVGKGFPGTGAGEAVTPLFERDGKLWDIRRFADGRRVLERRWGDRRVDGRFSLAVDDALAAVPAPDGGAWVLAGADDFFHFSGTPVTRRMMRVDGAGNIVGESRTISVARTIELVAGPVGSFRLVFGPDRSNWNYWPPATSQATRIEWFSPAGELVRGQDFYLPMLTSLSWAEAADGSFVATDARSDLRRYGANGVEDTTFQTPGPVGSVRALAGGKWLVDGLRRLNADGSEDATWTEPELTRPADVGALAALPDGRVLAAGNFGTVNGLVRNRLVAFLKNGEVDPAFEADERIGERQSVAVAENAIYVVTAKPVTVRADFRSNLVKLRLDGSLDEDYRPQVLQILRGNFGSLALTPTGMIVPGPPEIYPLVDNVSKVFASVDGDILVETYQPGGDVASSRFVRLNPDGSPDADFKALETSPRAFEVLALRSGGFVRGATIYRRDGMVERDLTRENIWLRPLCEWLGGVVFLEYSNARNGRLRLWSGNRWVTGFRPQIIARANEGVVATPDDFGGLYVSASWTAGQPELRRLTLTGRADGIFRAPSFGRRERQKPGGWWKAADGRRVRFDTKRQEIVVSPTTLLWQRETRKLWTGGDFTVVDGKSRDGLARLDGGWWWKF